MRVQDSPRSVAPPRSRRWLAAVVGLLAVSVAAAAYWWPRPKPPVVPIAIRSDDDIHQPAIDPNPAYVGMQACAECHAKRVAEVRTTKHFKACREPEAGMMAPGFLPGRGSFVFGDQPVRFENTQKGNEFFQTNTRKTPRGE